MPIFISKRPPITEYGLFQKMKNLYFLATLFPKWKLRTLRISNESNIWAKVYHVWKIEEKGSTIVEITGRRSCHTKEISVESLKFFSQPTTKWRLFKMFVKLNGNHLLMTNIFKLHENQTFDLRKKHNMRKIWFANNKFSLWKSLV